METINVTKTITAQSISATNGSKEYKAELTKTTVDKMPIGHEVEAMTTLKGFVYANECLRSIKTNFIPRKRHPTGFLRLNKMQQTITTTYLNCIINM